jgi:translation initiation factor 1 (eIF-1/SUI1)
MSSSDIFDSLLGAAHKAGQYARTATTAAREAWIAVEPGVTAAFNKARSMTDPQARAQALAQLDAIIARAKTTGTAALGDLSSVVASLREAANGMPPQLAVKLATFASVQEIASAKGALELPEVVVCTKAVDTIRDALKTNPNADESAEATNLEALIIAASTAVDSFSTDETSVRNKLADATTLMGDLDKINTRVVAAQGKLVTIVVGAPNESVDQKDAISALATTLSTAQTAADEGNFPQAAVIVYTWLSSANQLLEERQKTLKAKNKQSAQPESVEGFFSTLYRAAERGKFAGEGGNESLNNQAALVLTLARKRPCDVKAAEDAVQKFQEMLARLEADAGSKS